MREFERWTTTTANAYTQPMFDRYLGRLEEGLSALGFTGRLYIMTSSGGSVVPEAAARFPVRALESGPAPASSCRRITATVSRCRTCCPSTWAGRPRRAR